MNFARKLNSSTNLSWANRRDLNHIGSGKEIEVLWRSLKFATHADSENATKDKGLLGVGIISDLLSDLFRTNSEGGESLELLGGKVFRKSSTGVIPDEGYDLFYQFVRLRILPSPSFSAKFFGALNRSLALDAL